MNEQNIQSPTRKEIENQILAIVDRIRGGGETDCFDDEAVQDFFSAWRDLVKYYLDYADNDISVEVIREYMGWADIFGGMEYNASLSDECHENADEAYEELKGYLDDIILMVTRRLHPGGR